MTLRLHRARVALALTAAATVLATGACGSNDSSSAAQSSDTAGYPVSIQSALGTAEIKSKPQRVVTLGWGSTEAAVALGTIPVGMRDMKSDSGTVDGILPWVKDKLGDSKPELLEETSQSIPLEKIAALKPDVILSVQSGLTADQYAQLSKIAPTVAQPGKNWQTSWEDQTTIVGKALGKEDEANKLVEATNKQISDAKAQHPEFSGKTAVAAGVTTDTGMNLYFDTDPRVKLLAGLGFTSLPALAKLRETAGEGKFSSPITWENISQYNADVMSAWFLDTTKVTSIEANPAFTALPVVQKKSFIPITDPPLVFAMSSPNAVNMSWLLERYLPLLSTAAKNAG